MNAVVHREYALSGSILIKVFTDRIEFISPGGLVNGIELEDIMSGYSACRNAGLASIFYSFQFIEAYGTGILRIMESYKGRTKQPKIEVTPNVFKMILPNLNAASEHSVATVQSPEEYIMGRVSEQGFITRKQTEQLLGISQTSAGVLLRKMVADNMLTSGGNSRNMRYYLSL